VKSRLKQEQTKNLKLSIYGQGASLNGMEGENMANILIVDDQPHLQELFSQEFADEGHTIAGLSDAQSVMGYLSNSKADLVLLDLYLNGFEGWDVLHDIKSRYPHLPVLIVTAYDSHVDDARVSEADGYVIKSFIALDKLKQKIAHILGPKPPSEKDNNKDPIRAVPRPMMGQ
jgi:DNA-binding NtrC family response regulator